jgi:hypothetical protein
MSKLIVNCETGEAIERELNEAEIAQEATDHSNHQKLENKAKAEAQKNATAKQAILDRLGLTADEAKLLLG